jgi:transcription elongation factor
MNDHLRHLVKRAPGIIHHQSGFIFERVDSNDGLTLLKMQHVSPLEVGKWVQVRKGIYKGDMGYVTSSRSGGVELLLIPRLSQPQAPKGNPSHPRSAPALFDCETVKQLDNIEPVRRIKENIYSFRGDRFEHGLIIKSYASDLISMTVSCMPFESFCLFLESCHPTLMASRFSFPKPLEWHFDEGDTVSYIVDSDDGTSYHKSGVISMLRSDAVELSTEEGTVCVPWLKIRRVIHQGDFVEVTGGMYLGCRGWVGELQDQTGSLGDHLRFTGQVANIIKIEDKDKPLSDRTQVFPVPIPNECSCAHLPLRCLTYPSIY